MLYSVPQFAKKTGFAPETIYGWIRLDGLASEKLPTNHKGTKYAIYVDDEIFWEWYGKRELGRRGCKGGGGREKPKGRYSTFNHYEIEYIKRNYGKISITDMGRALNRSFKGIKYQINKMGLKPIQKKEKPLIPELVDEAKFYRNWHTVYFLMTHHFLNTKEG